MPGILSLTGLLDAAESAAPVDAVTAVTREVAHRLQATSVTLLVADTSRRALVRLAHARDGGGSGNATSPRSDATTAREESASSVPLDRGPMERVVRTQRLEVLPPDPGREPAGWTVLAPVTERGDVIGVLELCLPDQPVEEATSEIAALAHLLAFVLIANRQHTDFFEWGRRSRPLSLSAEIQQRLLPGPRTCEAGSFTLAGWLEPAADIAGDTFDYSLARDTLHLSMTDAMGHGVGAALTATLCVGALRGSRRRGSTLREQAASANAAVLEQGGRSGAEDFVTGLLGRIDLATGVLHLVNAGHVAPYLARGDRVTPVALPANLPFGMFPDTAYEEVELRLEPGDRLLFVTDGMLERGAERVDLPGAIREAAALHPRQAVCALADNILAATGHALSDDATAMCLDWHGAGGAGRDARDKP